MKPKVLFACEIKDPSAKERMEEYIEIQEEPEATSPAELAKLVGDAEGMIVPFSKEMLVTREVIDAGQALKLLGTTYGGVRKNVDDAYALEKGLTVIHTGASRVRPMAEYTLALTLSALLHIHLYHHDMQSGEAWPRFKYPRGRILQGRRVGVVGFGRIGRGIAELFSVFTDRISVYSKHLSEAEAHTLGVTLSSLEDTFSENEIVILAGGYTPETHHMIGGEQFALMREDALFVNIARGKMVDEAAMIEAVKSQAIYLALDVFEEEPLPADSPLKDSYRVLLTPHRANNAIEFEQRWQNLADEIEAYYTGKRPDSALTPERAARMSES